MYVSTVGTNLLPESIQPIFIRRQGTCPVCAKAIDLKRAKYLVAESVIFYIVMKLEMFNLI